MIDWLAALFLVVGFLVIVRMTGLVAMSENVIAVAGRSASVISDKLLNDDTKEQELKAAAKTLFGLFPLLLFATVAAFLVPLGVLWLVDQIGWISLESVMDVAISPTFIILSSAFALAVLIIGRKHTRESSSHQYSVIDRVLHQLAFHTYRAQTAIADFEDRLYANQLSVCNVDRPVFITSLPRAGTTLLLETCASMPEFASHCYRDMPFVLVPCFWNRFSTMFGKDGEMCERAHGDGVQISFDSHEALEEVIWKTFRDNHYGKDRIKPWLENECGDDELIPFLYSHLRKIIYLRCGNDAPAGRYISKNNLNIARVPVLHRLFPDGFVITPFRQPLHHAASLLQQHRKFLGIHKNDPFARKYMRAIGHFDFGDNLRPVDFNSWLDNRKSNDATTLAFWLEYWTNTFEYLLDMAGDADCFVSYEGLCDDPQRGLRRIANTIDCRDVELLVSSASNIHAVRPRQVDSSEVPRAILQKADEVYHRLQEAALN